MISSSLSFFLRMMMPYVWKLGRKCFRNWVTLFWMQEMDRRRFQFLKNNQVKVDLVILDMKMPYNGESTFVKLKKIKADVKIIIASGYAKDHQIREMMEKGCCDFIQKPFSINELSRKLINALND